MAAASRSVLHPEEKVPTVELVFTRLHAGGKFDKKRDERRYAFSGGLHGVGVSVTNALSKRLEVEVKRDGKVHRIVFAGGEVAETAEGRRQLRRAYDRYARCASIPIAKYFDSPTVSLPELERSLRAKAVLLPGVKVSLAVEKGKEQQHAAPGRIPTDSRATSRNLSEGAWSRSRRSSRARPIWASRSDGDSFAEGEGAAWAFAWYEEGRRRGRELRQSHSHRRRRHPRSGAARGAVRGGEVLRRPPRPAAARGAAANGGRLREAALRAVGAHPRSAVPGPGQGKADESRRAEAGRADHQDPLEVWLNAHVESRQAHRRARDPAGADAA